MDITSENNKASFNCPVSGDEELVVECISKRSLRYRGGSSCDVCDCAFDSGKCPVSKLFQIGKQQDFDEMTSPAKKKVDLPSRVKAANRLVVPTSKVLQSFPELTAKQVERLTFVESEEESKQSVAKAKRRRKNKAD